MTNAFWSLSISNAGLSLHGLAVDLPPEKVNEMIAVNVQAVSSLTHLFGKDMKERRRGRVLMVSSTKGVVAGVRSVAVYSATKAFEKSLATSLAKEMEPFGVGVTCLLPGAVLETDFRSRSHSHQALCWKIPSYAKTPPVVAGMGVRAMLRGETEVTPGFLNKVFFKVLQPVLPQRVHNLLAEIAWNPLQIAGPFGPRPTKSKSSLVLVEEPDPPAPTALDRPSLQQRFPPEEPVPRLLQLEYEQKPAAVTVEAESTSTGNQAPTEAGPAEGPNPSGGTSTVEPHHKSGENEQATSTDAISESTASIEDPQFVAAATEHLNG